MEGQININKADPNEVIKPKGQNATVFRDKSIDGSGRYYAKLPSGVVEEIGNNSSSANVSISLARSVVQDITPPNPRFIEWDTTLFKESVTHDSGGLNPEEITIEEDGVYEIHVSYGAQSEHAN